MHLSRSEAAVSDAMAAAGVLGWAIIGIVGALFVVGTAIGKGWRPTRKAIDKGEGIAELIAKLDPLLEVVNAQLTPNHGTSLLDRVAMIPALVAHVERVEGALGSLVDILTASCPLFVEGKCQLWRPAGHPAEDCPVSREGAI